MNSLLIINLLIWSTNNLILHTKPSKLVILVKSIHIHIRVYLNIHWIDLTAICFLNLIIECSISHFYRISLIYLWIIHPILIIIVIYLPRLINNWLMLLLHICLNRLVHINSIINLTDNTSNSLLMQRTSLWLYFSIKCLLVLLFILFSFLYLIHLIEIRYSIEIHYRLYLGNILLYWLGPMIGNNVHRNWHVVQILNQVWTIPSTWQITLVDLSRI